MLPKHKRLNLKKDFKWVAQGERKETVNLKVFFRFGDNSIPKVGIAVSKANFAKAHDRNRAKRIISEAVREIYQSLPKDTNLVIIPKVSVFEQSPDPDSLAAQIKKVLNT